MGESFKVSGKPECSHDPGADIAIQTAPRGSGCKQTYRRYLNLGLFFTWIKEGRRPEAYLV